MKLLKKISYLYHPRFLARRTIRHFILESVRDKHFSHVVDVGVGGAPYKKVIKHDVYTGIDVEDRGGVENVLIEDLNVGLSLPDDTADMVLLTEVLEHIKEPQKALDEIARILKKDGVLVMTTPLVWGLHEEPEDFFRYTNYGLDHLLKKAGFKNVTIKPSNGYLYTMCQLALFRPWSHWKIFAPVVFAVNMLGLTAYKFEKNRILPLGFRTLAIKK